MINLMLRPGLPQNFFIFHYIYSKVPDLLATTDNLCINLSCLCLCRCVICLHDLRIGFSLPVLLFAL